MPMDQPDTLANEVLPRTLWHTALLCSNVTGSILFSVTYFIFGLMAPNYEIFRQSIADLQLLPQGWVQSVNFMVFGSLICVFAIGLYKEMVSGFGILLIPLIHLLTGAGVILLGIYIDGAAHTYITAFVFISLLVTFFLFAVRFIADSRWKGWATYSVLSATFMIALMAMFVYASNINGQYTGIFERMIVITRLVWLILFTIKLLEGRRLDTNNNN
jgi:hypothetical protein